MKTEQILPVIDLKVLQQKANEAAMKGALSSIDEFYNGYNSPYKKAISENLHLKGVDNNFDIPDIVAVLNQKISTEIDTIANTAVAKTFIPLVKEFLTRESAEIKFSDILKEFIERVDFDPEDDDYEDFTVEKISRHSHSSLDDTFPTYQISNGKEGFEIHFHKSNSKECSVMSLPYLMSEKGKYYGNYETKQKMKISLDGGATLELPFTKGVLDDKFVGFCARLIIGKNNIIFDTEEFEENMFPERDNCHC